VRAFAFNRSTLLLAGIAAAGISVAVPSAAMTLGNVTSQSALGQSLRLVIPVTLGGDETISGSCLKLLADAAPGDTPQLVTGKVSFERGTPTSRLVVTTSRPVNEPALRVSVESGCGSTTRRDYVLLFDPAAVRDASSMPLLAADEGASTTPAAPPPTIVGTPTRSDNRGTVPAHGASTTLAHAPATPRHDERTPPPSSGPAIASARVQPSPSTMIAISPVAATEVVLRDVAAPGAAPHPSAVTTPLLHIVTMTRSASSSGFISTASAQPLQPVGPVSTSPTLDRLWPYAAVALCLAGLGMCGLAVRKQRASRSPSWMLTANVASKTPEDTHASLNTFAHFSEMTEPPPGLPRDTAQKRETTPAPAAPDSELHTLLEDGLSDEQKIRQEWAAAASEHAIDIGTDSILQAIATAEREMRIGAPAPAQVAMDKALDEELLRKPKKR